MNMAMQTVMMLRLPNLAVRLQNTINQYDDDDSDADVEESKVAEDSVNKAKGSVTTSSKFWDNFKNDGLCNGANVKRNKADGENFDRLRGQFLQLLCDNLKQRFPSSDLLEASACLNKSSWPSDPLERPPCWHEACCYFVSNLVQPILYLHMLYI